MFGFNAKSVAVSHPCTALFHNCYEIAECNEKMASSEPSATLLHICSVWKEQKPHEVEAAFQVESAILRVKGVNVCKSRSFRKALSGAGPRVLMVAVPPLKQQDTGLLNTWHHGSQLHCQEMFPFLCFPYPPDWLLCFLFPSFLPTSKMMNQLDKCKYLNIHPVRPASSYHSPGKNHFKCSYRRVTKSSLLLFKENKFHKQPQGQKHSPEEYEISNSLR